MPVGRVIAFGTYEEPASGNVKGSDKPSLCKATDHTPLTADMVGDIFQGWWNDVEIASITILEQCEEHTA